MAQQGKRKGRLFNLSTASEDDLSERMMIGASPKSIGADLRAAREARGESMADVAHQLRLRESYVEAIETGNFDALPGVTYAIGFLRSYARYLRLDADDLIQRFKEEVSDIPPPADLAFLEPVSESRVPRGGLVGLAVLLAVAAYGGWYYLSTRDMTVADLVPEVPEQFSNLVSPAEKSESQPPVTAGSTDVVPPSPGESSETATTEGTVDEAPPAPEQLGAEAAPQDNTAAARPSAPPQAAAPQPPTPPTTGASAPQAIPAVPNVPTTDGTTGARVYGEGNVGSRITLHADGDSWIQVRAADETLLMTRTLKAGDSYRVPNQSGLRLMTGNAGALEILVDGQPTPSLGPVGTVKRNILLEPDRLKAGTATN